MREDTIIIRTIRLDGVICAIVSGDLDVVSAGALRSLRAMLTHRPRAFILDLTGVEYIDSTGLRTVLALHRAACARDVPIKVHVRGQSHTLRVLKLVGADTILNVVAEPTASESGYTPPAAL